MSYKLKLLAAALSSMVLIACSNEPAQLETAPPAPLEAQAKVQLDAAQDAAAAKAAMIEKEAMAAKEAAMKAEEMAKAEAMAKEDAMMKAEAAAKKEAMAKAEAAELKAEQARAAALKARAEQQQAELDAQAANDAEAARIAQAQAQAQIQAQAARDAEAARLAQEQAVLQAQAQPQLQAAPAPSFEAPAAPVSQNAVFNNFLGKYVSDVNGINLVAYDKVTSTDRAALNGYIQKLSAMDIEALPRDAEMATWFNLYNAKTIELILENYPTKSIRKISNPWKKDRLVVNGKKMSLDDIEHGTVRKKYNEPRVHFAFNCASIGCPNLKSSAWEAGSLEADLTQAAADFTASERGVRVRDNGEIVASSIFKWYKGDFGGNEAGILRHLRTYATGSKKAALDAAKDIKKFEYDWDLNIR